MSSNIQLQVIALIILLLLSGFFSSAETSLVSCNKIRMRYLAEQGNKRAKMVLKMTENQGKMLSAILIGNNLVNTFSASIAATIAYSFGGAAVSIATFLITILILIFGEITPKTLATHKSEAMALFYVPIIRVLIVVLTPVIFLINLLCSCILRLFGVKSSDSNPSMTASELRTMVDVSHEEGVIEKDEREMINNVFDFGDVKAKDVMVPRVHVVMADVESSYEDLLSLFREEMFTRIPIYKDTIDNVIGLINMKDLLLSENLKDFNMQNLLRKAFFTYENKPISDLLLEMRQSTINLAIVLDEYGELAGIITLEDIIEEIVGEVQDEYDAHENTHIRQVAARVYDVKGYISLHDVNDVLHLHLDNEDYDSIGGLVIDHLQRLPKINDTIYLEDGTRIQVTKLKKQRIEEVRISLPKEKKEESK